ncbi:MAG: hypothetical protein K6E51_02885 [Treponema sp.]|nr:hypothetical protein [Treponema sp.]
MNKRFLFLTTGALLFASLDTALLTGESFRVHKTAVFTVSETGPSQSQRVGISDAVAIHLPQDLTFVQGIEIEIKIPQIVASWQDSVAWTFFDSISPAPSESTIDYSGSSLVLGTLPSKLSWSLDVPFSDKNTIKDTPYATKMNKIPSTADRSFLIRFQQAMKGVPDDFSNAELEITVKPILRDLGRLIIHATSARQQVTGYTVFIDNTAYDVTDKGLLLPTGVHTLSLVSDSYRSEIRTIRIEQAKTNIIDIELRDIAPTAKIVAPANIQVFFDGSRVENTANPFTITEGEHIVRFVLGNYELTKTITAVMGRSYTISFEIDATVTESE